MQQIFDTGNQCINKLSEILNTGLKVELAIRIHIYFGVRLRIQYFPDPGFLLNPDPYPEPRTLMNPDIFRIRMRNTDRNRGKV
jgi:hypothetical protein